MGDLRRDLSTILTGNDWFRLAALLVILLINSAIELVALMAVPLFIAVLMDCAGAAPDATGRGLELLHAFCRWIGVSTPLGIAIAAGAILLSLNLLRLMWSTAGIYLQARFLANRRIALASRLLDCYLLSDSADLSSYYHLPCDPAFLRGRNRSDLVNRCVNESDRVIKDLVGSALLFIQHAVIGAAIVALLFWSMPLITATALLSMAIFAGGYLLLRRRQLRHLSQIDLAARTSALQDATEALTTAEDTRLAGTRGFFASRFHRNIEKSADSYRKNILHIQFVWPYLEFVSLFTLMLVTLMSLVLSRGDIAAVATRISLLAMALIRLRSSAINLVVTGAQVRFNRAALAELSKDLRSPGSDHRPKDIIHEDGVPPWQFCDSLVLRDIFFRYDAVDHNSYALQNINLTIHAGQSIGIAGGTGCGKSTLLRVIATLEMRYTGGMIIDGRKLSYRPAVRQAMIEGRCRFFEDTPLDRHLLFAWRHAIGYVPQRIAIINDTIAANIALGIPPEKRDRAAIDRALAESQLSSFVASLPDGLETTLGDDGVRLSGGQLQRIGIARALYHNPQVLLLDEATAALDNETEAAIAHTLASMHGRRTIIIVAHRLSTIRGCDRIFFMDAGKIIDSGRYDELYGSCPQFRAMADAR